MNLQYGASQILQWGLQDVRNVRRDSDGKQGREGMRLRGKVV